MKFLIFILDSRLYTYYLFLEKFSSSSAELRKNMIKDFPNILYHFAMGIILSYISTFIIFFFVYPKQKKWMYSFSFIFILVVIILSLDILKFSEIEFFSILPRVLFESLFLYLISNFCIFFIGAIISYLFMKYSDNMEFNYFSRGELKD